MGCHLAKMLAGENHNLTIIDSDPDRLTAISDEADVVTILGNPTSIDTLERAGAKTADLFVSVFPDSDCASVSLGISTVSPVWSR